MYIRVVSGTKFFGDRDQVPGLFHVAAKCFHIYYVPLIPLGTYLVFDGTEREEQTAWWRSTRRTTVDAIPLRFSIMPLLWAWLRLICGLGAITGLAAGTAAFAAPVVAGTSLVVAIGAGVAMAFLGFYLLGSPRLHYLSFVLLGVGVGVALSGAADSLHFQTWHVLGALGVPGLYALERASYASRDRALALAIEAGLPTTLVKDYFAERETRGARSAMKLPAARVVAAAPVAPPAPTTAPAPAPAQPAPAAGEQPRLLR